MAITVPVAGQEISASVFGIPVANQLNGIIPTQWTVLPYSAGWIGNSGNPCTYRKVGDVVYVQGGIQWTGGTIGDTAQVICTLPAGFRTASPRRYAAWFNNTGVAKRVTADTNGQIYIDTPLAVNNSFDISLIYSTVG